MLNHQTSPIFAARPGAARRGPAQPGAARRGPARPGAARGLGAEKRYSDSRWDRAAPAIASRPAAAP